ncbi:hypothetical protein Tco_1160116, partial [Tanacetum coccineum]
RVRDKYHNLEHDEMVKSIFNLGKNKVGVGMKISSWMITDEMKLETDTQEKDKNEAKTTKPSTRMKRV